VKKIAYLTTAPGRKMLGLAKRVDKNLRLILNLVMDDRLSSSEYKKIHQSWEDLLNEHGKFLHRLVESYRPSISQSAEEKTLVRTKEEMRKTGKKEKVFFSSLLGAILFERCIETENIFKIILHYRQNMMLSEQFFFASFESFSAQKGLLQDYTDKLEELRKTLESQT